ncbi:MAG: hypothetical protein A2915_04350 [Candidatus Yanofskybacteria bacterium RIFCSPLOWO2_01_FULL_41_34]|uniref:Uncharacterized protein n=1 Tax=Candidatus Yanofskybacteria bacterium RIFCSPHIGHO2_01_FULL_41_26 TaxID=1802661 RepID=A0A1F8EBN1_9BACT|nr:MAG: hypothetical protein A2649_03450 [Candidatus Yanofskybacteria bacterium RIFCSPHIGHO2_01_FULL_41_26]OGN21634.1 MAG: hypothetical protein A2915_04350 [Candidatus Yanofskybacteria bacterium RIFCSPLOWO2_01_FULL_41_34]
MPKSDIEHELTLGGIFIPKLWKLQARKSTCVQKINNLSTINRIARQSVRMPSQNSVCFTALDASKHFVKNRSARNFGRLLFHQLLHYLQIFTLGKLAQFCELRFNREDLLILNICGFAGIQKEFLHKIIG